MADRPGRCATLATDPLRALDPRAPRRSIIDVVSQEIAPQPSDAEVDAPGTLWSVALVGVVGGLCALGVHSACFNLAGDVSVPEPDTPRAEYCSAVVGGKPWILLTIVPCVLVAVVGKVTARSGLTWMLAVATCVVLVANVIIANDLTATVTV
jgi:hypothetical protein